MKQLVVILTVLWSVMGLQAAEHTKDSIDMVKKGLEDKKAILVDVREKSEWDEGHIQDATWLPLSKLKKDIDALELDKKLTKDKIIYVHCRSGVRCLQAADVLKKAGYEVRPLKPGYDDLVEAGLPKAKK